MEKQYKVIALPTGEKGYESGTLLSINGNLKNLGIANYPSFSIDWVQCYGGSFRRLPYHLYIIDVKATIEEGNWYLMEEIAWKYIKNQKDIIQQEPLTECLQSYKHKHNDYQGYKIIASTDKMLLLPGIPTSFIQSIVNSQKIPEWVELEMKFFSEKPWNKNVLGYEQLKIESEEVIIK